MRDEEWWRKECVMSGLIVYILYDPQFGWYDKIVNVEIRTAKADLIFEIECTIKHHHRQQQQHHHWCILDLRWIDPYIRDKALFVIKLHWLILLRPKSCQVVQYCFKYFDGGHEQRVSTPAYTTSPRTTSFPIHFSWTVTSTCGGTQNLWTSVCTADELVMTWHRRLRSNKVHHANMRNRPVRSTTYGPVDSKNSQR